MISPVTANAAFARVDQGVDYYQRQPYLAVGDGKVYAITGGFAGGTGKAVYYELDTPVVVNGRSYKQLYVAETTPMVKVGQRVKEGQALSSGGSAELGFADGARPAAPLVGGLGAGTQATREGHDFLDFVTRPQVASAMHTSSAAPAPAVAAATAPQPAPQAAPQAPPARGLSPSASQAPLPGAPPNAAAMPDASPTVDLGGGLPQPEATTPMILAPGSGAIADAATGGGGYVDRLWAMIASQPNASPDTLAYVQNAALGG